MNKPSNADRSEPAFEVRSALMRLPLAAVPRAFRTSSSEVGETGRVWVRFDEPRQSIIAWHHDQVLDALAEVDRQAAAGQWVVGMVSYDAAPAFDAALVAHRHERVPLVAFGVFGQVALSDGPAGAGFRVHDWASEVGQEDYEAAISSIKDLIEAGETYQVNHTFRLRTKFSGDPLGLFEALCRAQGEADHVCFLDLGGPAICSASPELFFARSGSQVTSRPMKGTRPRHPDLAADQALAEDLVASAKDRAENTMIVDMTRNDLGRIATIGTLAVPSLHVVETYPTVHQLTSTVTAQTDASLPEIFSAMFPGASITGAPKVATTRIITELESSPRGVYCGALGVVGPNGFAEFNIAIRTVWVDRQQGLAEYGTGGGVVWDSEPTAEWHEAHHKARVLERACNPLRLLETIKYEPGVGPTLLDRHLDRLEHGAEHFGFAFDRAAVIRVLESVRLEGPARLRLTVAADGGIDLDIAPYAGDPDGAPWRLPIDTEAIDPSDELLYFKTTSRRRYDQARARFPHAPDVILWNDRGEVTETTIGNLVVEVDGEWVTPPRASGLLAGTFRAELLEFGAITERVITLEDLAAARRIWMINSLRGWVPAQLETSELLVASR